LNIRGIIPLYVLLSRSRLLAHVVNWWIEKELVIVGGASNPNRLGKLKGIVRTHGSVLLNSRSERLRQ
jgi:hypothetical protein